jgi:hypothetical protein
VKNVKRTALVACVAVTALLTQSVAAEIIQGRVVDGGRQGMGIAGVMIKVEDQDRKPLKSGLTDATGHYKLEVPANARYATFDKLQYLNRSARRTLKLDTPAQADVILVGEGRPAEYYRAVAKAFNESGAKEAVQYAEIVSALPPTDQRLVTNTLTSLSATSALASVELRRRSRTESELRDDRFDTARPFPVLTAPQQVGAPGVNNSGSREPLRQRGAGNSLQR